VYRAEGLILVTGPRASGKSTLIAAFVDIINRTRSEHVITLESQVKVVHEPRNALISQREVRGTGEDLLASLRGVLREAPDVIVIEDLRTPEVIAEAIAAASAGHLVIAGIAAPSAPEAVSRLLEQAPAERRPQLQAMLAETLRGVVAQVLLRKSGGGRVAARELLLARPPSRRSSGRAGWFSSPWRWKAAAGTGWCRSPMRSWRSSAAARWM
jgi:twitching motility protein PilT